MAKALIRNLLERTIGRYVEINVGALNVALWRGRVELQDTPLRKDAVDSIGLPVTLQHGP